MKIAAVIPTLGESPLLAGLTKQLVAEDVDALIFGLPGENLHHIWNQGAHLAGDWRQADAIAILNDDIKLPPSALEMMAKVLFDDDFDCVGVDPKAEFGLPQKAEAREIKGNAGQLMQGVTTWCFMVKAAAWQDIDEQYEWWWGVCDLFAKLREKNGRLGQIQGLGIEHLGSHTANKHHWTKAAIQRDAKRWRDSHK